MPKKITKAQPAKNNIKNSLSKKEAKNAKISSKKSKKQQFSDQQQNDDQQDEQLDDQSSNKQDQGSEDDEGESQGQSQEEDSDQGDQDSEQESEQSLAPENYAIRQMKFRERRGTKMNYLMNRKKQEEEDPFWQNQGQNYFGDLQNEQEDEDYQQSSSGRDQFDSDFDQTQSQPQEEEKKQVEVEVDEDKLKQKKKQQELMRKIGARTQKKSIVKTSASQRRPQSNKKPIVQPINRYIHQVCTQQQLLGQAAQTQYINWLSLQKLISLQNQKKDFTHKQHFLQGDKIIYRDKIDQNGKRYCTYELIGVKVNKIQDLTSYMNKNDMQ